MGALKNLTLHGVLSLFYSSTPPHSTTVKRPQSLTGRAFEHFKVKIDGDKLLTYSLEPLKRRYTRNTESGLGEIVRGQRVSTSSRVANLAVMKLWRAKAGAQYVAISVYSRGVNPISERVFVNHSHANEEGTQAEFLSVSSKSAVVDASQNKLVTGTNVPSVETITPQQVATAFHDTLFSVLKVGGGKNVVNASSSSSSAIVTFTTISHGG